MKKKKAMETAVAKQAGSGAFKHICPECGAASGFIFDSRPSTDANIIRHRRYRCPECEASWSTHEIYRDGGAFEASPRAKIKEFLREQEALARRYFGDKHGSFKTQ